MLKQASLWGSTGSTSLPGSGAGTEHSPLLVGKVQSSPRPAPVNRFRAPVNSEVRKMNGTSGLNSTGSSASYDLALRLGNRLAANLGLSGSPEYTLIWRNSVTPSQLPISRLRASARPISGSGCGGLQKDGWPKTPTASDGEGGVMEIRPGTTGKYKLRDWAHMAGWRSPNSTDHKGVSGPNCKAFQQGNINRLPDQVDKQMAGWKTPIQADASGFPRQKEKRIKTDRQTRNPEHSGNYKMDLKDEVQVAGWSTPQHHDHKGTWRARYTKDNGQKSPKDQHALQDQAILASGPTPSGIPAETGNPAASLRLNPIFSLWLMGYPAAWGLCGLLSAPTKKARSKRQ